MIYRTLEVARVVKKRCGGRAAQITNEKTADIVRVRAVRKACLIAFALFLASAGLAAELGNLTVYSSSAEPLDAEIELRGVRRPDLLSARLASAEAYRRKNLNYARALDGARLSLQRRANGRLFLRARTLQPLHEPTVELLVELESDGANTLVRYTIPVAAAQPGAAGVVIQPVPATRATRLQPSPPDVAHTEAPPPLLQSAAAAVAASGSERASLAATDRSRARAAPFDGAGAHVAAADIPRRYLAAADGSEAERTSQVIASVTIDRSLLEGAVAARPADGTADRAGAAVSPPERAPRDLGERPPPGHTRILNVPRTDVAPVVDGALDEAVWKRAVVASGFWISEQERWPTEQTEVLVMADREHLYFGFRVYDRQPETLQTLQTRRGAGLGLDDQVAVQLDPYLSHREISTYSVSASGVQDDAIAGGRARQLEWKGDWHTATKRTSYGWSAEIAIPFAILNYEPGTTTIGVNFLRYHNRTAEWSRWADTTVRGLPEEMGRLTGLQLPAVARSQPWTFMPYLFAGRNISDKRGKVRETLVNAGGEIRYQPRPNMTGVLALNPDFSQVESAITNINFNYNERFRPDPRPFFQEGSAYFSASRAYFYSNRIPDFDYGAKFFTRTAGYQLGALATRAPNERSDMVFRLERELTPTHSVGGMLVATDRPDLKNALYVVRGQGREASGLNYAFDAAASSTSMRPGDGTRLYGSLGWAREHWSVGVQADRYSTHYFPANALLEQDLPDTRGYSTFVSYYRDFGDAAVREVRGDASWTTRRTGDGRLQRRLYSVGGSVEVRQQVRTGLWYHEGLYRPVAGGAARWSPDMNDDYYWTAAADFNTRSSRLGYGISHSSGFLGGGEYRYVIGYGWARPTATTFISATSERLSNFGTFDQTVVSAGWDISPRHGIVGRVVNADYGRLYRLAYSVHVRRNIDFFLVYDDDDGALSRLSAKTVITLR